MKRAALIGVILILFGCSKTSFDLELFSKYLCIQLPKTLELKSSKSNNPEFDILSEYEKYFSFKLTPTLNKELVDKVKNHLCDPDPSNDCGCWRKIDDGYEFKVSDSVLQSGYYIDGRLSLKESTLVIHEVNW